MRDQKDGAAKNKRSPARQKGKMGSAQGSNSGAGPGAKSSNNFASLKRFFQKKFPQKPPKPKALGSPLAQVNPMANMTVVLGSGLARGG